MTALIFIYQNFGIINWKTRDFPGGAMDRNSPARAGDVGSIPGPGRFRIELMLKLKLQYFGHLM